ncbi:hypothetical protein [Xenorhabdus bovienii]|uniref:Uncharacterized protein n=1 Tax=Xenorhabdus bovienii str. kraussei Becker Underwood TaxID=1398204 RepID=A0A077PVR6_XENBV|nr:hypothetical protein [Xenorhabdus bovienii]CDH25143.1 hypothetical protein XBKB1_3770009 [Xenorhabdus bovienii str. kraussei Becker Underwood]
MEKTPEKLQTLIYFLTKEAARNSYSDFLEGLGISNEEYSEIKAWFSQLGIEPYV